MNKKRIGIVSALAAVALASLTLTGCGGGGTEYVLANNNETIQKISTMTIGEKSYSAKQETKYSANYSMVTDTKGDISTFGDNYYFSGTLSGQALLGGKVLMEDTSDYSNKYVGTKVGDFIVNEDTVYMKKGTKLATEKKPIGIYSDRLDEVIQVREAGIAAALGNTYYVNSDGSLEEIKVTNDMISGFDTTKINEMQTIKVTTDKLEYDLKVCNTDYYTNWAYSTQEALVNKNEKLEKKDLIFNNSDFTDLKASDCDELYTVEAGKFLKALEADTVPTDKLGEQVLYAKKTTESGKNEYVVFEYYVVEDKTKEIIKGEYVSGNYMVNLNTEITKDDVRVSMYIYDTEAKCFGSYYAKIESITGYDKTKSGMQEMSIVTDKGTYKKNVYVFEEGGESDIIYHYSVNYTESDIENWTISSSTISGKIEEVQKGLDKANVFEYRGVTFYLFNEYLIPLNQ